MFCLGKHLRVDIVQGHEIHRTLVGQVSAVLVITHTDGSPRSVLILTDEVTGVNTFGFQTALYQVTETVITDHAAEGHFGSQSCCIGREDSRRGP